MWAPSTDLGVGRVLELSPDEGVEGIPVSVGDVAAYRPQIAEDERGTDDRVELGGVCIEVDCF